MDPEDEVVETSSRDDINAAITKLEGNEPPAPPTGNEPPAPPAPKAPAAGNEPPAPPAPKAPASGNQPPAPPAPGAGAPGAPTYTGPKAPQSFKPEHRAAWEKMAPELQQEVLRREAEINQGLQAAATARQFHEAFQRVAQPYSQYLAAHAGGDPLKAFDNYLRTATLLRTGSPVEKANAVATAIQEYGIDVTLLDTALASVLQGQPLRQPAPAGGGQPQTFHDPRLTEFLANQDAESRERIAGEVKAFMEDPKNEFYQDVKGDMADYMDFKTQQGQKCTMQQAYDFAVKNSESVQKVIAARSLQTAAARGAQDLARKKAAATPGAGRAAPAGTPTPASDGTTRGDIAAAIAKLEGVE